MKKNYKYSRGITIVSLVITIILLLILAGISIQALTNTGLFEGANQAKKETQRAQVTEWLNLKLIEEQSTNPTGTSEEIIEATRQNVVEHKNELEKIGNPVTVEDTKTEEDGEEVEIYFYVQVDEDVYKVEMAGAKFIGEAGKFPPIIKLESITGTTNSITVQVTTKRNEGGTIDFYIKKEGEATYTSAGRETDTNSSCTFRFTELEQNKKYNIKIVATSAENGQTAEVLVDKTLGSVPDLAEGDITFTYSVDGQTIDKDTWTNKEVTVTASTTVTGYTLQTSTDGKTWSNLISQTFSENGEIYAALYDGTNYGGSATGNVTNIDTTKPVVTGATATTNSIEITATDEASGIVGYAVTESSTAPSASSFTPVTSTTSFSTTVTGKTQGTTYHVWVKDAAGNISESRSASTGNVPGLATGDITFKYFVDGQEINKETWTNKNVTVTASTGITGYTLQTKKENGSWSNETSQTFTENGEIYAVLYDGTNYGGSATGNVTNIDTTKPVVTGATATTNSIEITATDEASGIVGYAVTESSTAPSASSFTPVTSTTSFSTTVTGKTQGTTYHVWVKDAAGNISESRSASTGNVPGLATGDITFKYFVDGQEINKETWTNKNVTVTASTGITGYTLQTKKENGSWSNETSQTFTENGEIYAVLYDGTNYGGSATGNVTNIDTTKPVVTGATATTNSIEITATDEASGIVGYAVTESSTAPSASSFTPVTSTTSFSTTVTGKTQGTTYHVWVKDAAGNISASKSTGTGSVTSLQQGDVVFTFNPSGWTNGSVKVTAALKQGLTSNYTLKIIDSDPRGASKATALGWKTASEGITVSSNKAVYGILVDNEGQIGGATSGNVTNIDTTKPIVTEATATTNSIKITATDEASGIVGYAVTESSTEPSASSFTSVTSTTSFSTTVTGKTQGTTYYVWVKDAAGNVSASKSTATGSVTGTITFGTTTWSGGKASTTISTNTSYTIQYQVNSTTGTWKTGTNVTGLVHGDKVYARLWDGTNGGAASAAYNILDGTAPSASISLSSTSTTTAASITATVTHSDSQSGVKIASCKWVYNTTSSAIGTNASSYTGGTFSSNSQTITLSATTAGTYYLHVLTTDVAGNVKETISNAVTIKSPYSTLASKVSVGDYVAYDATNNYSYTSPKGTGPSHGNGNSSQTFTSSSSIKWRVLSTNTSTGEVVLISEAPIGSFTMQGAIGYLYAEQELNNICSIYGHGTGANTSKTFTCQNGDTVEGLSTVTLTGSGARSINVDDINNITGYTPTTGISYTYTICYPTKNKTTGYSTSKKSRTDVYTYYYYKGSTYLTGSGEPYKMLFRNAANSSSISYWLASRCVYCYSSESYFGARRVYDGSVDYYNLCFGNSSNFARYSRSDGVRPVVYLKSSIQTNGKDSSGAWTIIDK